MYSSKKKSVFLGTTECYSLVFLLTKKKEIKQATVSPDTTFQFMLMTTQK